MFSVCVFAFVVFLLNWLAFPPVISYAHRRYGLAAPQTCYDGFITGVIAATVIIVIAILFS